MLPIHGFAVPFHINSIKNASKNDEGDYAHLRVNFQTPGQLTGKKEDTVSIFKKDSGTLCSMIPSPSKIRMPVSFVL